MLGLFLVVAVEEGLFALTAIGVLWVLPEME
jgi:hypothetical protein